MPECRQCFKIKRFIDFPKRGNNQYHELCIECKKEKDKQAKRDAKLAELAVELKQKYNDPIGSLIDISMNTSKFFVLATQAKSSGQEQKAKEMWAAYYKEKIKLSVARARVLNLIDESGKLTA